MDFPESKASLIAKQACSELPDRVPPFCSLERSDAEDQNKVLGMQNLVYHAPARATINVSLPWYSSAVDATWIHSYTKMTSLIMTQLSDLCTR